MTATVYQLTTLPTSEVFGPVWQGEGPYTGQRVGFVRLGLCNLSCSWCDTPYTWDTIRYDVAAECPDTTVADIHARLDAMDVDTVVVSGGEPLIHHQRLADLMDPAWMWHVETNGTIPPPPWWSTRVLHTSVSPKVITDDPVKKRLNPQALTSWHVYDRKHGGVAWKFVARTPADVAAIADVVAEYGINRRHVWVMPEGTNPLRLLQRHSAIADAVLDAGFNTTTRLHVLLYGNERGR